MPDRDPWHSLHLSDRAREAVFLLTHAREPLIAARAITILLEEGEVALRVAVEQSRAHGRSWEEIAAAVGVTRQAVQKRFGAGAAGADAAGAGGATGDCQ